MPNTQIAPNASPSASSIFLPLGRRARRDSKSSLSAEVDQNALHQALNTIHSAASQSSDLTVFNEYTDPPSTASKTEQKTLAADLSSGLTGLYNKLKSSVGVPKEVVDNSVLDEGPGKSTERSASRASSARTSRVQSPKVRPLDTTAVPDALSHSSRLSSKGTSVSKVSLPNTPTLKSPTTQQAPSHYADPTISEFSTQPSKKSTNHSRASSSYDVFESGGDINGQSSVADEGPFRNIPMKEAMDNSESGQSDRRLRSPPLLPLKSSVRILPPSQEFLPVESSNNSNLTSPRLLGRPLSPSLALDDTPISRVSSSRQESVALTKHITNPLDLLGDQGPLTSKVIGQSCTTAQDVPSRGIKSPALEAQRRERLIPRVSESRLPGFHASRTSSTDSGLTTTLSRIHRPGLEPVADDSDVGYARQHAAKPPNKLRSKLLNKEFWMRDENARDCFHCGEPFSTFRRKHHCRTCGQIFDNKCTTLINAAHFGGTGVVRVCKPCEAIIVSHDDDSSDFSVEDLTLPESVGRPRTPDPSKMSARFDDDNISTISQTLEQMAKTPTLNFPVRQAFQDNNRISKVLDFEASGHSLPRPSSSRSLKGAHLVGHTHKRHHSRHQHVRNFKAYHEERAPFQRRAAEDAARGLKASAFHRDSVIDPDLAQYLSDDASSGEEQSLNMHLQPEKLSKSVPEIDRTAISGLLAAVRKGRSRIGDRSIASFLNLNREADDSSVNSSKLVDGQRPTRHHRNLSVASSVHQRLTPKATRERLHVVLPDNHDIPPSDASQIAPFVRVSRMIRSASMHGLGTPSMELNRASIQHVHKMLQQLLRDANVAKVSSWEDALIPILLKATDDVDPDVQAGDDMDIRNYVKLKKIPGGKPVDTAYISGLIFSKNVALKSMSRLIMHPRILIITFALEYARHEQHFMSLDPVIRQEKEYLENLVGRIAALRPDVLLAQRNISGLALELLDRARIATIFNVKSSVLEAVSRCTQTRVAHSVDKLTSQNGQLGTCESFEIKTFVAEGRKKNYVYLSGCPSQLGCTIAIRGADRKMLSKIKKITEFMVYVVYNLKLETCLMRDEWALIPTSTSENLTKDTSAGTKLVTKVNVHDNKPKTVSDVDQEKAGEQKISRHIEDVSNVDVIAAEQPKMPPATRLESAETVDIPDDIPVPTFYEDMVEKHETKILSASPFVKFMQPYLLMRARELERRVAYLRRLRDQDITAEKNFDEKAKTQKFTLIQPEMLHTSLTGASKKVREIIHAVHDAEYDKALHNYETQKRQWETYLSGNRNLFDPYAHQNIVVLFSQVSTATSVPCSGPDLLAFGFYNEHEHEGEDEFEADCSLGQFVEDLCYRANDICHSESCGKRMFEHHRQYVHGEAQITVFVQPYPAKMRGLQDVILMWSQCKICGVETTVTPMSASTWKYSFGKYLELSFWSSDLHARAGICPHDLHRDHLRYFGYKDLALRVHYDPIDLLEIVVPRMRIAWKVDNDLPFRNEVFTKIEHRITRFMVSVKLRLKSINVDALPPENAEACREEIERLTKRANEEHTTLIKMLQERYSNSKHWEIIPLNRAVRATQEKVAEWEAAFAEFEKNFFPSEKDIRRLATLQLKKIFLDRDISITSLTSDTEGNETPPTEGSMNEKLTEVLSGDEKTPQERKLTLTPENAEHMLQALLKEQPDPSQCDPECVPAIQVQNEAGELPIVYDGPRDTADVQHLDLAIPQAQAPPPLILANSSKLEPFPKETFSDTHAVLQDQPVANPASIATPGDGSITTLEQQKQAVNVNAISEARAAAISDDHKTEAMNINRRDIIGRPSSPLLLRAHSQPAGSVTLRKETSQPTQSMVTAISAMNGFASAHNKTNGTTTDYEPPTGEKTLSDRLGFSHLKNSKFAKGHSFIPRAISHRKESRVSNLAKHFEQLSREFERERVRERKLRAARNRTSRIYPLPVPKPIVEVYRDVDEAVDQDNSSEDMFYEETKEHQEDEDAVETTQPIEEAVQSESDPQPLLMEGHQADETDHEADAPSSSRAPSETDERSEAEEEEEDSESIHLPDSPEDLLRLSQEDVDMKELPKHERSSLMKMLTNFWAERSSSGWAPLEYPVGASEHVFADCDIIVREDEPSSIIAFALDSADYKHMLRDIQDHSPVAEHETQTYDIQADVMHSLLRKTGTHLKYQFQEGSAKMMCKIFYAEQFDAVRKKCGVADRIVESLSRCLKWDSKGGKTKSVFLKTLDDRFVLKSLSPIETQSFLKFAPNYFQIMSEAFFHELPSVIAKMLGFYQIIIKSPVTGVEYNWYLLLMENLFYDRVPTRIFDLKGSMRNRKINATGERNEVLLDENMVEFIYESPLFAREHSKKLLRSSVHNDTLFLARQNVMDYSLMVAIDEHRKELVVGIIDCIRTYTWDKKLESWIKDRGFAGGGKNRPTVTSPKEYKRRFREAMGRYVLEAPNCWHQFKPVRIEKRVLKIDGDGDKGENEVQIIN